ncbi:MAG: hypothetical protein ACR2QJ_09085 [Geminicoccaceae bacterium]
MLVELIGPAGIGKTTAARRAKQILEDMGVDVLGFDQLERLESEIGIRSLNGRSWLARGRIIAGLLARRPDITLSILLLSWLYGREESTGLRRGRRRRTRRVLGHLRMALTLRKTAADRVVLLDEGFTQVLWTLLIDSPSLRAKWLIRIVLRRYHQTIGQRGVRFIVDDEQVVQRVFARNTRGRFNRDSSDQQRRDFPRWLDYFRKIVDMLPAEFAVTTIDGSSRAEAVATELVQAVLSILPATDRPAGDPVGDADRRVNASGNSKMVA